MEALGGASRRGGAFVRCGGLRMNGSEHDRKIAEWMLAEYQKSGRLVQARAAKQIRPVLE